MAVIQIGRSSSQCLGCHRGASPSENGHQTILEYGADGGKPGCGEPWTGVRLDYSPCWGGIIFENLCGLPVEGFALPEGTVYPPKK